MNGNSMLSAVVQCVSSVVQEEDDVVFSHSVCHLLSGGR